MSDNNQTGFSLIELMVVIGIVGILAMIAMPNYQGYTTKARCLELFQLSEPIKLAMIEEHLNGTAINDLKTSQIDVPKFGGKHILKNLEVNGPKLTLTANHQKLGLAMSDAEHLKIHFILQADNHHQFEWGCQYELSDKKWQKFLPKLCQGQAST